MTHRELIERPWRLVYRIDSERVLALAVLDGRRDLRSLLLERLIRSGRPPSGSGRACRSPG